MSAIAYLTKLLKSARLEKNLSQRALSLKTGIQQTQISRIESGRADLRVSTLVELARFLDLELVLIPRPLVPAVNSITRKKSNDDTGTGVPGPAYHLDSEADDE